MKELETDGELAAGAQLGLVAKGCVDGADQSKATVEAESAVDAADPADVASQVDVVELSLMGHERSPAKRASRSMASRVKGRGWPRMNPWG